MFKVVQQTKVCCNPNCVLKDQPQPIENFSKRSRGNGVLSECRACMRERVKQNHALRTPKTQPSHKTEIVAISRLHQEGIPALPGKAYHANRVDILVWGCVPMEVKTSTLHATYKRPRFQFHLTPAQSQRGLLAELVMFICDYEIRKTFHILPANHPVFYINGHLKTSVIYCPDHPDAGKKFIDWVTITDDIMKEYQDRWDLIEQARQKFSEQLRSGAC